MTSTFKRYTVAAFRSLVLGYFVMCSVVAMEAIGSGVYDAGRLGEAVVAGAVFALFFFYVSWRSSRRAESGVVESPSTSS